MNLLIFAAVCFTVITFVMWVCEEWERMRRNARKTLDDERSEARRRASYCRRCERSSAGERHTADQVEDLRFYLDHRGPQGFVDDSEAEEL